MHYNELNELSLFNNTKPLFIEKIEVRKRTMQLVKPFQSSYGRFDALVRFFPMITFRTDTGEQVTGVGECPPLSAPWYDGECHRSAEVGISYIMASLTGKSIDDADGLPASNLNPYTDVISFMSTYQWIGGHHTAKVGFEGAYWDAVAQLESKPMYELWGGSRQLVSAGTSVGLESSINEMMVKISYAVEEMKVARIKLKVVPGKEIQYLEAVRKHYPDIPLMVDANGVYDLFNRDHLALLKEMDQFNLMMIEQPGRSDDILDHARQLANLQTPICLDESIINAHHANQAINLWKEHSSLDRLVINIKPPRVGGYYEAIRIAKLCGDAGVSAWCGGMYESALGKTANVHFNSRPELNLPGDHVSQGPYFTDDIAASPEYANGQIRVPEGISWGIGEMAIQ